MTLVASGSAAATTMGWMIGIGPFGFMQQNPMVWISLIQAYLLMTIIAVLLILGAGHANTKKWHVVGALAHSPPLIAAFSSLDAFASMGVLGIVWIPITLHLFFFTLESSRRFILTIDKGVRNLLSSLDDLLALRWDYWGRFRIE